MEHRSDKKLTMNHWHKIRIVRRGNTAEVSVDTTTARSRRSIIPSSILNVDDRVYLGGLEARKERYDNYITRCLIAHSDKDFIELTLAVSVVKSKLYKNTGSFPETI